MFLLILTLHTSMVGSQFGFSNVDPATLVRGEWDPPYQAPRPEYRLQGNVLKLGATASGPFVSRSYLAYRAAVFAVYTVFFRHYVFDVRRAWAQFTQFSYLGTLLLDVQLGLLLLLVAIEYYKERTLLFKRPYKLKAFHKAVMVFTLSTSANALCVSYFYWFYKQVDWEITPKTLFLHLWNSILVVMELFATQLEWRLQHFYVSLLTPCWYGIMVTSYFFWKGRAIYPEIDWNTDPGSAAKFYLMTIGVCLMSHCAMCGLYLFKKTILKK